MVCIKSSFKGFFNWTPVCHVRRAGMASYTELLETAGLKVPFEEGSIKGIAQQMTDWLETHQV